MDPTQIVALITARNYLALAIVVIGYLTRLTNDTSRFPVTVPARFQPLLPVALAMVYLALQKVVNGTSWRDAAINAFVVAMSTMGLYDVVIKACFNGREPKWLAWLAFIKHEDVKPSDPLAVSKIDSK